MDISTDDFSYLLRKIELFFSLIDNEVQDEYNYSKIAENNSLDNMLNSFRFQINDILIYEPKIAITKLRLLILVSNNIFSKFLLNAKLNKDNKCKRRKYLQVLNFIEDTLNFCEGINSDVINELPISDYKLSTFKFIYNDRLKALKLRLYNSIIDKELAEIILSELRDLIKQKFLSRTQLTSALELITLLIDNTFSTQKLEEILIVNNFNSLRYIRYTFNKINKMTFENSSIHSQLNEIIILEENLYQLAIVSRRKKILSHKCDIYDDLKKLYKEKKDLLIQRINIRRKEIQDEKLLQENEKLTLNISVSQFALLIRLFVDSGLLPKDNMRKTFNFFTTHFRTPSTVFISTDSMQKKSTDVEFSTALKIKALLLEMVNIVNTNHNASHYKQS